MDRELVRAFRFFMDNAGFIGGQRAQGALALAKAEREAERRGWFIMWHQDAEPWQGDIEGDIPQEVLVCVLYDEGGEVLGAVGGNEDPTSDFRRTVEAELALDALFQEAEIIAVQVPQQ